MKALVTGANGFLGSYVVRQLLDQDDQVRIDLIDINDVF
ncbi:MAG: SDR family oxidoreductase [Pirellulaceae bacterium]|nr:SDR family oxidoreductase [Pirellulaceae bacterium]